MRAVILAAGEGQRLRPLTSARAKPMMPVVNRPVMEHIITTVKRAGISEIFSNLYYRPGDIQDYFGNGAAHGVAIRWKIEDRLTGPAGAVLNFATDLANEPHVLVVSGDALHDVDLVDFIRFHYEKEANLSVVMKRVVNPGRYGIGTLDNDGRIVRFEEKPLHEAAATGMVSCGIYCMRVELLKRIPRGQEYDFGRHLIPLMAAHGEPVYGYVTEAYWRDIGDLTELRLANLEALVGQVRVSIPGLEARPGIFVEDGAALTSDSTIIPPVLVGHGTRIGTNVTIIGPAVLGAHVVVDTNAQIHRSVLLDGVQVPAHGFVQDGLLSSLAPHAERF